MMSSILKLFLTLNINSLNTELVHSFYKLCSLYYNCYGFYECNFNCRSFSVSSFNNRSFCIGCLFENKETKNIYKIHINKKPPIDNEYGVA